MTSLAKPDRVLATLRRELARVADPERARPMQAYMKSAMPYHGVASALARQTFRKVFADVALDDAAAWRELVLAIWRGAKFREERYGAIALADDRRARAFRDLGALPVFEELIVTGAWWDYVDFVASHLVGELLETNPKPMRETMLAWSTCGDMWKRRTSIICQLRFKEKTDLELLYRCIEPSLASKEFFLRKAIGWALRQYAWTDPGEVERYVRANEARLSGLSKREALKKVGKTTVGRPRPARPGRAAKRR